MGWILDLYRSAMFKKAVMAVTGFLLFGFVVGHMAGNLKVYFGAAIFNHYAEGLRTFGEPFLGHGQFLWIARIGLLVTVGLHIWSAVSLTRTNRAARPQAYVKQTYTESSYASRTMIWGGAIIALFVIYHLLHLTGGQVHPDFVKGDVFHNFVRGFQDPLASSIYIVANIALGFHLYHGLWSMFQTIGWSGERFNRVRKQAAVALALLISIVNISFPVAVLTGILS